MKCADFLKNKNKNKKIYKNQQLTCLSLANCVLFVELISELYRTYRMEMTEVVEVNAYRLIL
jgi:hypothetical protein